MTLIRTSVITFCLFVAGCGYHVAGAGIDLPRGVDIVHIALFDNPTKEPYLDSVFTDSMSWRLLRHHNIDLVENAAEADAVLSGSITQYHVAASAYDAQDAIQSYRVTMRVMARLARVEDGKILWQGDAIRYQDFVSSGVDISSQEGLEVEARKKVADRLAEDLSWQMASGFGTE